MKRCNKLKSTKGITLIALVITIIVLLILAAISIATLTGENGLLTKADTAKEETRGASVQEARDIWKMNKRTDRYDGNKTAQTLNELLDDLESQKLITPKERVTIEKTEKVKIGSRTIDFSERTEMKVGDYVNYSPTKVTTAYNKFSEKYSGYDNEEITQDLSLKWRILKINENTVVLISDRATTESAYLQGSRGYNNGVALINDYCRTMYSNKEKEAVARNLNIEDIENEIEPDPNTGKKIYETFEAGKTVAYGRKKTYTDSRYNWYPLYYENCNGRQGESEPKNTEGLDIKQYETEKSAKTQKADGSLTVISTDYGISHTVDNPEEKTASDLMFDVNGNHWLSSRFVRTGISSVYNPDYTAAFGMRYLGYGSIFSSILDYTEEGDDRTSKR